LNRPRNRMAYAMTLLPSVEDIVICFRFIINFEFDSTVYTYRESVMLTYS